jgi:penicillin-binding protein 2
MPDFFRKEHSKEIFRPRLRIAVAIALIFMAILLARLWHMQLIEGESYDEKSRHNRVRLIRLSPSRGKILDVKGLVLAEDRPSFTFSIVPAELENPKQLMESFSSILGISEERMRALIERSRLVPRFMNFPIKKNMSLEEVSLVRSSSTDQKGVLLEVKPLRLYPFGEALCHELGNLGELSADELGKAARLGYRPGDLAGKSGIEKEYEPYLRGQDGWEEIEIDAKGRQLANLSRKPARAGADVTLTIDVDLQRYLEEIFIHRAGSAVAVDPDSGRIIAMVSKPGFDLNLFSPSISEREWKTLTADPLHPLENRSVRGLYSPASAFKIVTAAGALSEKLVTPSQKFMCTGKLELAGQTFRCWNHAGHGEMSLHRAIVESCDMYFYQLGRLLGPDRMAHYSSLFGLGKPTGLGLPQELPGLIPSPAWKQRNYGDSWKDGETLNFAIGQGYLVATPIQLALMTAAVANGGRLLRPAIVQRISSPEQGLIFEHEPVTRWNVPLAPKDLETLRSAMNGVVSEAKGTGRRARLPGIRIAAKTGTSQVIREKRLTGDSEEIPYHERTHAIFVAYVDDRPKKIALVVIVEHGGAGGLSAAPIARKIIARYYGLTDPGEPRE